MPEPIDFYFDFSSPYGYLAAEKIEQVVAPFGRDLRWRPILLGAAFKQTGSAPLVSQPLKADYAINDLKRMARFQETPFVVPDPFPIATVRAARGFYWLDDQDPAAAVAFAKAIYRAYFAEGRNVSEPDVVDGIAAALGHDAEAFAAGVTSPEIKDRLRQEVDASLARGVFGSPFVIVDGEAFWGADRFWMIKRWLKSGGW
ncbi:MAG: 2-hydroxychromene-2-carboxylate isomerase [Rhodospirillales bacterium]